VLTLLAVNVIPSSCVERYLFLLNMHVLARSVIMTSFSYIVQHLKAPDAHCCVVHVHIGTITDGI